MRKSKRVLSIIMALCMAFTCFAFTPSLVTESAYASAEEQVKFANEVENFLLSDNNFVDIKLSQPGAVSYTSSKEEVAEVSYSGWEEVGLELKAPGTTVITATDENGNTDSCTVNVDTPEIIVPEKNITYSVSDDYIFFEITSGYDLSFSSSNESVVTVGQDSYDSVCYLNAVSPGKADVRIKDPAGKTETVKVTINEAEWELERTSIDAVLSDSGSNLDIATEDYSNEFSWVSSDNKVVTVADEGYGYGSTYLEYKSPGTATITVTDKYGKKETCKVTVKPDPISLDEYSAIVFDVYGSELRPYSDEPEEDEYWLKTNGDNYIVSVKSSNSKVVEARRVKEEDLYGDNYYLSIKPVGVGTATVTATDQYGQTASMKITVTQKYLDEKAYWDELTDVLMFGEEGDLQYGDKNIYCSCDIAATVYTVINGKKYTGSVDEEGDYVIRGIPILPAGTKIAITLQKGQAKNVEYVTIGKKSGAYLSAKVAAQTFSGKGLKPKVTLKDGKTVLKAGRDYTVSYSNNKNVGKGKATITFKGNYKGSKAAYFTINPKSTKLKKVSPTKKGFTVKWKKQTKQTTGYQIQYSTNKKFKSGKKLITIKKNKTTAKKITKLKAKKKYYVRIRTYKKVGKTNYYSKWSAAKAVTTKR